MRRKLKYLLGTLLLLIVLTGCVEYRDFNIIVKKQYSPSVLFFGGEYIYYLYDRTFSNIDDLNNYRDKPIVQYNLSHMDYSDMSNVDLSDDSSLNLSNDNIKNFTINENSNFDHSITFNTDTIETIDIKDVGQLSLYIDATSLQKLNVETQSVSSLVINDANNANVKLNATKFEELEFNDSTFGTLDLSKIEPYDSIWGLNLTISNSNINKLILPESTEYGFDYYFTGRIDDFRVPLYTGDAEDNHTSLDLRVHNLKKLDNYLLNGNTTLERLVIESKEFTKFENDLLQADSCSFKLPKITTIENYKNVTCTNQLYLEITNIQDFDNIDKLKMISSDLTLTSKKKKNIIIDDFESIVNFQSITVDENITLEINDEVNDKIDEVNNDINPDNDIIISINQVLF